MDNQEVEKNNLSSEVINLIALISCHLPFNCTQLSAAGGDGGQSGAGEDIS